MSQRHERPKPARRAGAAGASAAKTADAAQVVNCMRRLFKAIQEYSKAIYRTNGLSGPQVWAMTALAADPGLSLGELSERLFAHPATVSGIIDRLEQRRAVVRTTDPEDRRGVRLSLSTRGRRLLKQSPPPVQVGLRRALEGLPALQLRQLRRSLEHVVRATVASGIEAPFFDVDVRAPRRRSTARRPAR
jgi:DNA-binding MarR family transcriptional regulator